MALVQAPQYYSGNLFKADMWVPAPQRWCQLPTVHALTCAMCRCADVRRASTQRSTCEQVRCPCALAGAGAGVRMRGVAASADPCVFAADLGSMDVCAVAARARGCASTASASPKRVGGCPCVHRGPNTSSHDVYLGCLAYLPPSRCAHTHTTGYQPCGESRGSAAAIAVLAVA